MKKDLLSVMKEKAGLNPVKIVICEGWDERCLKAAATVLEEGLAEIILLGEPDCVKGKAKEFGVDISKAKIVDYKNDESLKKELSEKLVEVRKHKGLTLEEASKLIEDENYFGCMYGISNLTSYP